LHNGGGSGLFDELGHLFYAEGVLDTARGTTIPAATLDVITGWKALGSDPTISGLIATLGPAQTTWQGAGAGYFSALQTCGSQLIVNMVNNDTPLSPSNLTNALTELIAQMVADSQSVKSCIVGASVSIGAGNYGDGVLLFSTLDGEGRRLEYLPEETLTATVQAAGNAVGVRIVGDPSVNANSQAWPAGSGANSTVTTVDAATTARNFVTNGGFETSTVLANAPDSWIISVGTPGTQIFMPAPEVQQVAVGGSGGAFLLRFTDKTGTTQSTVPIPAGSSAATVQSALRALNNLSLVTVTSIGTVPYLTYTITFIGYGGALTLLAGTNELTGSSSLIITRVSAGTGQVFSGGGSLWLLSDGVTEPAINSAITGLSPLTPYAVSIWASVDFVPLSGVVTVELINGINGSVIENAQGNPNSFTFSATALTGTWAHVSTVASTKCVFQTPANVPSVVYLRIRVSTAIDSGKSLFLDQVALSPMNQVSAGGLFLAGFKGSKPFAAGDGFTVTTTNDLGGKVQTYCNRFFAMASLGLILPSVTTGGQTIPESVIE
jgi:hypothetical protein